jgi:hypothetical protein
VPPGQALAEIVFFGVIWGALMGAFMYLGFVLLGRRGIEKAPAPRSPLRESADATRRRVIGKTVALLALLAVLTIHGKPQSASGVCLGGGGLLFAMSCWMRRLEEKLSVYLLREPGWKRGRDRGLYVADRP